jgi:type II secretory pathway predicted ATPase ExeA
LHGVYLAHFGLQRFPFAQHFEPGSFVALESQAAAQARLGFGLHHPGGIVLVTGPSGVGKTRILHQFAHNSAQPLLVVPSSVVDVTQLTAWLLEELMAAVATPWPVQPSAVLTPGSNTPGEIRRLRTAIALLHHQNANPIVLLDDLHLVADARVNTWLRGLVQLAPTLRIALATSDDTAGCPDALADLVTTRVHLEPLTLSESREYLNGRIHAAGRSAPLFEEQAATDLHHAAEGSPRRLNRLADLALMLAFADGLQRPNSRCVRLAIADSGPERFDLAA